MPAQYCDEGLTWLLQKRNADASGKPPESVRLYTNNYTPAAGSVVADFTEVGATMGYIAKAILSADWGYNLDTGAHILTATMLKSWTFSAGAGLTLYGYFVTDTSKTKVMFAEKFPAPITIPAGGGTLALTINDDYQNCG